MLEMAQHESEIDRQRKEEAAKTLRKLEHTWEKGPMFFMWTDDDGHGFFLRMRVPRGESE